MSRYLVFLPSLLGGVIGGVWLMFRPLDLGPSAGPGLTLVVAVVLIAALLAGAWLCERLLPSFRYASCLLEQALADLQLSVPAMIVLAALTAVAEELLFRGALLSWLGVWGQAVLFGLAHPAPRQGWSYTAYTLVAGVLLGYATLLTGQLWAAILAHFVINLQGFAEVRKRS
ncbi:MAG: CPBP family intramembrane metalloprotease [Truepera sp.]|nr:CPBP family intramembrane metalloprotease [Truepera sp.]